MWVLITRDEKQDGQLIQSSSESEAGMVDRESHGAAEVETGIDGGKVAEGGRRRKQLCSGPGRVTPHVTFIPPARDQPPSVSPSIVVRKPFYVVAMAASQSPSLWFLDFW
jgi:hypothetical protein